MTRRCIVCGAAFAPSNGNQKICSEDCRRERERQRLSGKRYPRVAAEREAACVICGARFTRRANQKTCSETCSRENQRRLSRSINGFRETASTCVVCGKPIDEARRSKRMSTCSDTCHSEKRRVAVAVSSATAYRESPKVRERQNANAAARYRRRQEASVLSPAEQLAALERALAEKLKQKDDR